MNKVLIGILLLVLLPVLVSATDYYVDKDSIGGNCNDNNPGTLDEPWCTIAKANPALRAGDTIYIRAGIYEENDQNAIINPRNSGSEDNYITYTNYQNEEVTLRSIIPGGPLRGILICRDYIIIDGINIDNIDQSQSIMETFINICANKRHVIIQNCEMQYLTDTWTGAGTNGVRIDNGCSYVQVLNNTIKYVGRNDMNGNGNGVKFQEANSVCTTQHCLIEGNTFEYAGHDGVQLQGKYNVIRKNFFHNPWQKNMGIIQNQWDTSKHLNLIEENIFYRAGDLGQEDPWGAQGIQCGGSGNIIRRNKFYENFGVGLNIFGKEARHGSYNKVYNNVIYDNGKRNLHNNNAGIKLGEQDIDGTCVGNVFKNNIVYNHPKDGVVYVDASEQEQVFANNHWQVDGNPDFVNPPNDFSIQPDSPCIDAGTWLTTTRSAGSGISMPVEDASYFTDGFDIVEGDLIQLEGESITARIISVDYDNNILMLNSSLTWDEGQGVHLPYSGIAPDIGAYEFVSSSPTPPPLPIPGDLNNDGSVVVSDLIVVAKNFGLIAGFDEEADTDGNNVIDIFDVVFVASRFT